MKVAKGIWGKWGGIWVGYDKDMLYTCLKSSKNNFYKSVWLLCCLFRQWPHDYYMAIFRKASQLRRRTVCDPVAKRTKGLCLWIHTLSSLLCFLIKSKAFISATWLTQATKCSRGRFPGGEGEGTGENEGWLFCESTFLICRFSLQDF